MTDVEYEAGDINVVGGPGADAGDEGDEAFDEGPPAEAAMPTSVLTYLAEQLSNDPDAVVVTTDQRGRSVRLSLHVAPDDMGRVIGRRGRTAQALRTLVGVAGAREGVQTNVDIVDD